MKTIYTAVMTRLKDKVPSLRWIDLDIGQLETADRPPVAFPCALIGLNITSARDVTDNIQLCTAQIKIRLAFDRVMKTDSAAPEKVLATSLSVYDSIAEVTAALQGWGTENFEPFSRVRQQKENTRNGIFIYSLEFVTSFEDNSDA